MSAILIMGFCFFDNWAKSHILEYNEDNFYEHGGKALCGVKIVMTQQERPALGKLEVACKECMKMARI